ncbi:MAG: hypothetical protein ACRC30_05055 [Clostridium sp.]
MNISGKFSNMQALSTLLKNNPQADGALIVTADGTFPCKIR